MQKKRTKFHLSYLDHAVQGSSSKAEDVLGGSGRKKHKKGEGREKMCDRERDNTRALQRSSL